MFQSDLRSFLFVICETLRDSDWWWFENLVVGFRSRTSYPLGWSGWKYSTSQRFSGTYDILEPPCIRLITMAKRNRYRYMERRAGRGVGSEVRRIFCPFMGLLFYLSPRRRGTFISTNTISFFCLALLLEYNSIRGDQVGV